MEELTLSGLPHAKAFNPGMIEWQGRILLLYRVGWGHAELYLGELSRDFQPQGEFRQVTIPGTFGCEDARFFVHRNRLHFSCVAFFKDTSHLVAIGEVNADLSVSNCRIIPQLHPRVHEKNWIFFSHGDNLFLTYAFSDGVHQVYRLIEDRAEPAYRTTYENPWRWGLARGGTQLIHHDGLLYGFFHGTELYEDSLDKSYFMGAYAVAPEPPFPIVKMSRTPLYTPSVARAYPATPLRPAYKSATIFPTGLMLENAVWRVCAGYNNDVIKIFSFSHAELEANLISTRPAPAATPTRQVMPRVHSFHSDRMWIEPAEFVSQHLSESETIYSAMFIPELLPEAKRDLTLTLEALRQGTLWVIFHKDHVDLFGDDVLAELKARFQVPFANAVFVVFTNKKLPDFSPNYDPEHVRSLWAKVRRRRKMALFPLSRLLAPAGRSLYLFGQKVQKSFFRRP